MTLEIRPSSTRKASDIAIIGMGCLFPDAANLDEYWNLIKQGHDAIRAVPLSHWRPEDYFHPDPKTPDHTYAKTGGFLKPYAFDPLKFGIAPQALEATDSTQLLGMVCAHEALVDAGYGPDNKSFNRDRVSCIIGVTGTLELVIPLGARLGHPIWKAALEKAGISPETTQQVMEDIAQGYVPWQEASFPGLLGNVVAGRIANRLDLGGTNSVVDAACASSLAAMHMAMMELQSGRSDMVITGGMDTFNDIFMYMCFSKTPALSPTGSARPYDAEGDGTILGEGLGTVILKRVDDAERDGDRIFAVIRSIGSSSDGKGQAIYAPSAKGQTKALERAYSDAGVSARSIELVEGHGTGTKVGDGVELEALTGVYRQADGQSRWCSLGSVKSQIGHTKAAAGAAGLIKAALALHHKVLPPTIKVQVPHPKLLNSPFMLSDQARPWVAEVGHPRRAAVSAFGFGGSNYHAVLEEYSPQKIAVDWDPDLQIIAFSAENPDALRAQVQEAAALLQQGMSSRALGRYLRARFSYKAAVRQTFVIRKAEQLKESLATVLALEPGSKIPSWLHQNLAQDAGRLAFVFAGQGSQEPGMLRQLTCLFPEFLASLQLADAVLKDYEPDGPRLSLLIYPPQAFQEADSKVQRQQLTETRYAQLALGALGVALIKILQSFGIKPDALAGHSYGELLALHAAGALSEKDLLQISYQRGRFMRELGKSHGAMLAVMASEDDIRRVLDEHQINVEWANFNADKQIVLGFHEDRCAEISAVLKKAGIGSRRLEVSTAFHTSFVEAAVGAFHAELQNRSFQTPVTAVYANSTAARYPLEADQQKACLSGQIARPVQFSKMLRKMRDDGVKTFVEIGPQKKLQGLLKASLETEYCLSLDSDATASALGLAQLLAQLASLGHAVNLMAWDAGPEAPLPSPSKKTFTVSISGANYRQPSSTAKGTKAPASEPSREEKRPEVTLQIPKASIKEPAPTVSVKAPPPPAKATAENKANSTSSIRATRRPQEGNMSATNDSWQRFEKIMQDMHEIQRKTADAHTLFLENQRQFQGLLQGMISGQAVDSIPQSAPARTPPPTAAKQVQSPSAQPSGRSAELLAKPIADVPKAAPIEMKPKVQAEATPAAAKLESSSVVFEVLAQCTGYPSELLSAEMNLEGDLGIDSIKKVEIFSQLQARHPELEADASRLGELQTIADLLRLTASKSSVAAEAPPRSGAWAASTVALVASTPDNHEQNILQVVSEKTGFPLSMLQADMELEADLGIDSIKKVEIFSVLQERLPQLAGLGAEELNGLRRISDLFALLGTSHSHPVPVETSPAVPVISTGEEDKVWQVLSDKTGYPREVLSGEMNLESDLGIDSIKRVEIFSGVAEAVPALQVCSPEKIAALQTVQDFIQLVRDVSGAAAEKVEQALLEPDQFEWDLSKKKNPFELSTAEPPASAAALNVADLNAALDAGEPALEQTFLAKEQSEQDDWLRCLQLSCLESKLFSVTGYARQWKVGTEVWIGDDGSNLARNIMLKLQERGLHARLVSLAQADRLHIPEKLHGLVILAPLKLEVPPIRWLGQAFKLLRKCGPALLAEAGESLFAVVTRHGGRFGLDGLQNSSQVYGSALAALAKTAAEEWPLVHARALDLGRDFTDGIEAALRCLDALLFKGPVELGVSRDQVFQLSLAPHSLPADASTHSLLRSGDLILVTGGARGVTAASLMPLARHWRPRIVIWGRTPLAGEEHLSLASLSDPMALKRGLLQIHPELASPRDLEAAYRLVIQARELRQNIHELEQAGAQIIYETVDVSKEAELRQAFTHLVESYGVPVGLIHGAGVIRDKLIADQKDEEFFEVLDTKLRILPFIEDYAKQGLRWVLLFSSSTARLGRKGQVAYGVANETLNKFAQYLSSKESDCYALAFNWGPWSGGMVNEGLKKIFAAEGVATIPLEAGAALVQRALEHPHRQIHELMVLAQESSTLTLDDMQKIAAFTINVQTVPILLDHIIKQRAVVPAALLLEWMTVAAQTLCPDFHLQIVRDFQVWKGIVLDADQNVSVWIEKQHEKLEADGSMQIEVQLLGLNTEGKSVRHARAYMQFAAEALDEPQELSKALPQDHLWQGLNPYSEILFHGENLHLIQKVQSCSRDGVDAQILLQDNPAEWSQKGLDGDWKISGEAIDAIFQAAIIWCSLQEGRPCLPAKVGQVELFHRAPAGLYQLRLRTTRVDSRRLMAKAEITDADQRLIMRLYDIEAVMDAGLSSAFQQTRLITPESSTRA